MTSHVVCTVVGLHFIRKSTRIFFHLATALILKSPHTDTLGSFFGHENYHLGRVFYFLFQIQHEQTSVNANFPHWRSRKSFEVEYGEIYCFQDFETFIQYYEVEIFFSFLKILFLSEYRCVKTRLFTFHRIANFFKDKKEKEILTSLEKTIIFLFRSIPKERQRKKKNLIR